MPREPSIRTLVLIEMNKKFVKTYLEVLVTVLLINYVLSVY